MLTVFIDFKSPASYLALGPTLDLARESGATIVWLPFSTRPFSVPEEQADETVGERHRRVRAIAQRETFLRYAAVQGRAMKFARTPAGCDFALAAMAAMDGDPVPFIESAFAAYWTEQADLDDEAVVGALLSSLQIDIPDPQTCHQKLQSIEETAQEFGVFETPSYCIADQLFVGREHLPWVKTLITQLQVQ